MRRRDPQEHRWDPLGKRVSLPGGPHQAYRGPPYFKFLFYLFLERGEGKEKERDRNINVWLPLMRPLLGTQPETQACALTGNQTGDPLVHRPALNPLSYTSQGLNDYIFKRKEGQRREGRDIAQINCLLMQEEFFEKQYT